MANWCFTSYTVMGDEKELNDLYKKMMSLENREEMLVANGFGKTWLGNLVALLGGDYNEIRCRGEWIYLEKENGCLFFDTQTAWTDAIETIEFLQLKYPNLQFYYRAEEPGCEYYVTNDSEGIVYNERYYFSPDEYNEEGRFYTGDEHNEFLHDVGEFVGKSITSITEAYEAISEYNENKENDETYSEIRIYKVV